MSLKDIWHQIHLLERHSQTKIVMNFVVVVQIENHVQVHDDTKDVGEYNVAKDVKWKTIYY